MNHEISGIHHITAIAGSPQENVDFYSGVLGLRLVKVTVNFDDPGTYHLYYGDGVGSPGTIITFFPWPGAPRGRRGTGQVTAVSFAVPPGGADYWEDRLAESGISVAKPSPRFGEKVVSFADPDGLQIELIESSQTDEERSYGSGPVPAEFAVRGFHSATLTEEALQKTATLLTETLGFQLVGQEGNRSRYSARNGVTGSQLDVLCAPEQRRGNVLVGIIHHLALRTPDDDQQRNWLDRISRLGHNVSPVMDRKYFHSIYFREPGGILLEIATDPPGFGVDEPMESLGTHLVLPPWLEDRRAELKSALPPLELPQHGQVSS